VINVVVLFNLFLEKDNDVISHGGTGNTEGGNVKRKSLSEKEPSSSPSPPKGRRDFF
jgi:hypothetical protein